MLLLIDNDNVGRTAMAEGLRASGHETSETEDGGEALQFAA